jgi:hypothetical protein
MKWLFYDDSHLFGIKTFQKEHWFNIVIHSDPQSANFYIDNEERNTEIMAAYMRHERFFVRDATDKDAQSIIEGIFDAKVYRLDDADCVDAETFFEDLGI